MFELHNDSNYRSSFSIVDFLILPVCDVKRANLWLKIERNCPLVARLRCQTYVEIFCAFRIWIISFLPVLDIFSCILISFYFVTSGNIRGIETFFHCNFSFRWNFCNDSFIQFVNQCSKEAVVGKYTSNKSNCFQNFRKFGYIHRCEENVDMIFSNILQSFL